MTSFHIYCPFHNNPSSIGQAAAYRLDQPFINLIACRLALTLAMTFKQQFIVYMLSKLPKSVINLREIPKFCGFSGKVNCLEESMAMGLLTSDYLNCEKVHVGLASMGI